jgi:hypothetical protein
MFRHFPKIMERVLDIKSSPPLRGRAPRKSSLTSRVKAAQKAGASVDIKPDGTVTAAFGTEPIPNEWDTDLGIDKPRGH